MFLSCIQHLFFLSQLLRYPEDGDWEDEGKWPDRGASGSATPDEVKDIGLHLQHVKAAVDDDVGKLLDDVGKSQP